jgi:glycosyltransferase involved in cell wall biosynthesis
MESMYASSVLLIPAHNEAEAIGDLIEEVKESCPGLTIVVINDASEDETASVARAHGAILLDLPLNLGVAGAMQAGFRWACEQGFQYAFRCDGDGQHPPSAIPILFHHMKQTKADLVIGSRFLGTSSTSSSLVRRIGIGYLAVFLSRVCRHKVTDPTSGFQLANHYLMHFFSHVYPEDYPEPESLALLRRQGYAFSEVGVPFRDRMGGTSSLKGISSLYFAIKVTLALVVDRARGVDKMYSRTEVEKRLL